MRSILADIFRFMFRFSFFKERFYGLHRRLFFPYRLFRGVRKEHVSGNGIHFDLAIDDWIPENLFFLDEYEGEEIRFLESFIREGFVAIDIGANIGLYTLTAARLTGDSGEVIAFEPFTENFQSLQKNVSLNQLKNVRLEKLAIADEMKNIALQYETKESNKGMVSAYGPPGNPAEICLATSLDLYLEDHPVHRIDFIKIDIEGGEYPALMGMRKCLERFAPVLLIEMNETLMSSTGFSTQEIYKLLHKLNYHEERTHAASRLNRLFKKAGG